MQSPLEKVVLVVTVKTLGDVVDGRPGVSDHRGLMPYEMQDCLIEMSPIHRV